MLGTVPALALLVGRFHALTRAQAGLIGRLGSDGEIGRIACVITSSDHAGTRRNPFDADTRAALVEPALAASGKPYVIVRLADVPDDAAWPWHVVTAVERALHGRLRAGEVRVYSANRDVNALFQRAGYRLAALPQPGVTPHELLQAAVDGRAWAEEAAPSTRALLERPGVLDRLRTIFRDRRRTDDGELAAHREFDSYGAQMDASLAQKLEDLSPWVVPGCIVDKGCGTGRLLVELSRRFPGSSFVGVDLSRELLRRCDENTYHAEDVAFVLGDAAGEAVAPGSASTVIFSSIMHEIYTYSGYRQSEIDRALASAARELRPGGRVLIRDGVSPGHEPVYLQLLYEETRAAFSRFAAEFKHGQGAAFERTNDTYVRLSLHLANEFLCKKDYQRNWHIEVHEEYGARTVEEWRTSLAAHGFEVVSLRAYVNPWIDEHRYRGRVEVWDEDGHAIPFPATNFIAVGERPGGAASR